MVSKSKQSTIPLGTRKKWDEVTEPFKRYFKRVTSEREKNKFKTTRTK